MAKHIYDIKIDGVDYVVASDTELSNGQAYQAALAQHSATQPLEPNSAKKIGIDTVQSEPETWMGGAWKGWNEGSRAGLRGFVKGVGPGAVGLVKNAVPGAVNAVVGTGKGLYNLATDPETALRGTGASLAAIPGKISDAVDALVEKGGRDPEALGNDIGQLTGGAMAGSGLAALAPLAPTRVLRGLGDVLEKTGTKGALGMRIVGAHQLASGNPMGVATMLMPSALAKSGRAMRMAATEEGAAAASTEGQYLKLHQDIQTNKLADVPQRLDALQDDLIKAHADARLPEQLAEVKKQQQQLDRMRTQVEKKQAAAAKPTPQQQDAIRLDKQKQQEAIRLDKQKQKDVLDTADAVEKMHSARAKAIREEAKAAADEAKRVADVEKSREGMTPQKPVVTETVRGTTPEGAVHTKTTRYSADEPPAGGGGTPGGDGNLPDSQYPNLTKLEVSLLRQQRMPEDVIAKAAGQAPLSKPTTGGTPVSTLERAGATAQGPRPTYPIKPTEGFGTGVSAVPDIIPQGGAAAVDAAPTARPKLDLGASDKKLLNDLIAKAKAEGYVGDERALAEHLYDKVVQVKDSLDEFDSAGTNPHQLRQAIKEAGGFNVDKETALGGELENLKSFDKSLVSKGDKGLTVDGMLEHLGQDPRFQHITDINSLLEASKDAAGAGQSTLASKLKTTGVEYGKPWWKQIEQAADDADISFDPSELEKQLVARDAPGASANARSPLYEDFHNTQLEQEMAARDALRGTPADVAHSPVAQEVEAARTSAPTTLEGSLIAAPDVPPMDLPSLPPSRSRTNAAKGGLTGNDVAALKKFIVDNPDADPEMIAAHLADQRAARSMAYRVNTGMDKGARMAAAQEPE